MTRNVAQKGSARPGTRLRLLCAGLALLAGAAPALAGDRAQANSIGFSDDGQYFAFEQYGILDGSGGFYSDVFILDLAADKWLSGVPFSAHADGEDETQSLANTRATALKAATPLLEAHQIHNPISIAALNGDGVLGADSLPLANTSIHFGQPFYAGIQYDYTLDLKPVAAGNSATCTESADGPYQGFALTLTNNETKAVTELHKDAEGKALPSSRGCALSYSLYSVIYPLESEGNPVALISIYTQGFEGLDRRFMAVPLGAL